MVVSSTCVELDKVVNQSFILLDARVAKIRTWTWIHAWSRFSGRVQRVHVCATYDLNLHKLIAFDNSDGSI